MHDWAAEAQSCSSGRFGRFAVVVQFASRLSLIAFATASIRGVILGTDFQGAISTALIALLLFYGFGLIAGWLARRVVEESVQLEIDRWKAEILGPQTEGSSQAGLNE